MKLLVTGGAGFIGSNFVLYWVKKYPDDFVVNLDKLTYSGNLDNLIDIENASNYRFVKNDICNPQIVDELMKNTDIVVHFAAETHVDRSIEDPALFLTTNVFGTQILLEAAQRHKIKRFHHISTDEVFGSLNLDSTDRFTEKTPYDPKSPYAASKAGSDHLVRAYANTYKLPVTISNCSNNFGPFQFPEKLIPLAITNILQGKKVPIYGDGLYIRDWLYVKDHVKAIELILKSGQIGATYLIGGAKQNITNIDLIKKILTMMNKDEDWFEHIKDRPGHDRKYAIDWSKIQKELGWEPKYQLDEALLSTINWYTKNQQWWQKLS